MPKLIFRCNYLKNAPPSHLANYINYISTREGVEKVSDTNSKLPATARQKDLIEDILKRIEDADRMHEYYDYIQRPTRENASEFITQALENNLDLIAKKKNYIDYLANRPGVEKIGTHGLFSDEGKAIVLSRVMDEVANHDGVIWTNVISLRREDAERLGYDSAEQWQSLLRSRVQLLCENYKIDGKNLKWYAAFHNESHHPHVHLVVYSAKPSEGYLSKNGIEAMRSAYAHDIFRQEFMSIYEKKNQYREQVKEQAEESLLFLLEQMKNGLCRNKQIEQDMHLLSKRLMNIGGKKVYGYLKKDVKAIVNRIVDELAKDESVAECYRRWCESKNQIILYYKDYVPEPVPLSEQKELKSIKNMVIQEAVRFGKGYFYVDEDYEVFFENDPAKTDDVYETAGTDEGNHPFDEKLGLYAEWTDRYIEARDYLYGTDECELDEEAAYEIMKEEAENGNAYAMYDMGMMCRKGIFIEPDEEKSSEWYQMALEAFLYAESKHRTRSLEYYIGKMYQYGMGTEENPSEAAGWYSKSASHNHKIARYALGMMYLHGNGVEQDEAKAIDLLNQSYEQGYPYAAYELGKIYANGIGTEQDLKKSEKCFCSALQGFLMIEERLKDDALWYRIGSMYLKGIGTEKDERKAEYYLLKAKESGNVNADYGLGKLYLLSEEGLKNIELAVKYLSESADSGNQYAQYLLGKLYLIGKDVPQDREKAYEYFNLAAEQGNVYAAYFLEHWNDMPHPDLLLMTTRLMKHLEQLLQEDIKKRDSRGNIDRKLARKLRAKKIAQGHARNDHEEMVQTQ